MIKLFFKLSYQILILLFYITLVIKCNCNNQPAYKSHLKPRNQKDITKLPSGPTPTPTSASKPSISSITDEQLADIDRKFPFLGKVLNQIKNNTTRIDINKIDTNHYHTNALHQAIELNNEDIVDILLTTNINVNQVDIFEDMPLHLAIQKNNKRMIQSLLEKGAIVDRQAINLAENEEIKNLLCEHNQDPNNLSPIIPITREMIQKSGGLNTLKLFQTLQILRKNPNAIINFNEFPYVDNLQQNLLHQAVSANDAKILEIFLNKNLNINQQNFVGNTPLHIAVMEKSSISIVQLLVDKGADVTLLNIANQTPINIASLQGKEEILNILITKLP